METKKKDIFQPIRDMESSNLDNLFDSVDFENKKETKDEEKDEETTL